MRLLSDSAIIYLDGGNTREIFALYAEESAERHASADDNTLKQALIAGLNASIGLGKKNQGQGNFRVSINQGKGYIVYKTPSVANVARSASIFHYHWNYDLDGSHKANDGKGGGS